MKPTPVPDVASRDQDIVSFFWTLADFCREELLPFLFADAEDDRQQYTMVVHNVTARLREATPTGDGAVSVDGEVVCTFRALVELVQARLLDEDGRPDPHWAGPAIGAGTVNAFIRRLFLRNRITLLESAAAKAQAGTARAASPAYAELKQTFPTRMYYRRQG